MDTTVPSIQWIKRRAKSIKAAEGLRHHQALDAAARESGFQNLRHAQSANPGTLPPHHAIYITVYWHDYENPTRSGRLTLCASIRRPLLDFLTKYQVTNTIPYTSGFKLEFHDHLELRSDAYSLAGATETAHQAAKALNFVERTGLQHAGSFYKNHSPFRIFYDLEGTDHKSYWQNPNDESDWLFLDEPYHEFYERPSWAKSHDVGYAVAEQLNQSIYLGGEAYANIFAPSQQRADELLEILKTIAVEQKGWTETLEDHESEFLSPARIALGKKRKPRPRPHPPGTIRGNSISYGGAPGSKSSWRPAVPLPLELHNELGPLTYALEDYFYRTRRMAAMDEVKYTVEKWLNIEHGNPEWYGKNKYQREPWLFEYAYRGLTENGELAEPAIAANALVTTKDGRLEALRRIRSILLDGYPDCPPLRSVLKRLDTVVHRVTVSR